MKSLKIGITHGDINGIGYELILKLLQEPEILELCTSVIFDCKAIADATAEALQLEKLPFYLCHDFTDILEGRINLIDVCENAIPTLQFGQQTEEALQAEAQSLTAALTAYRDRNIDVLVTLPGHLCNTDGSHSLTNFISRAMGIEYPKEYHSLVDLCEELLRGIRTVMDIQGDTLFLEAFMDELQSWVEVNGNDLKEFLRHWNENDFFIGTPDDADAIRIMTIHKSKGLEFPLVIFPFAEGVKLYHEDWRWCHLNTEGTGLDKCLDGIYPIKLNGRAEGTFFEHDLLVEKKMQIVDNLNVTYVALTRAMKELYVISRPANKTVQTIADILHEYVGGTDEFSSGEPYDYSRMERKPGRTPEILDAGYPSFSAEGRFKASTDAADFFGEDGTTGPDASARRCGIVQHDILASVNRPEDLRGAVDEAVLSGAITADQGERYFLELSQAIDDHRDWFSGDKSFNETSIIGDDGLWHRPDRVIVNGEAVTVIDYKFGTERPSYRRQVSKYMELYRKMGHDNVRGYVWLVPERKVIEV